MMPLRSWAARGLMILGGFAARASAHGDLSQILGFMGEEIRENPSDYLERAERAWLLIKHDDPGGAMVMEDIDSLMQHAEWREHGLRLRAFRLYLLGQVEESRRLILENLKSGIKGPEQARLLGRIELERKDTNAAIAAYTLAWKAEPSEDNYLTLLNLQKTRYNRLPTALLEQGLRQYGIAPGVTAAIFEMYRDAGDAASLRKCLQISTRAQALWPYSVDWKLRHARVLIAMGQPAKAEPFLLGALNTLEQDPRMLGNSAIATAERKDIFALLDRVRATR